jgi:nitrogen fixation NifU-like protein
MPLRKSLRNLPEIPRLSGRARWLAFLPRNRWRLGNANAHVRYTGPCDDTMEIWLRLKRDTVAKATFDTDGCDAAVACGSAVTLLLGGLPEAFEHCALLAATTLRMALDAARERIQPS